MGNECADLRAQIQHKTQEGLPGSCSDYGNLGLGPLAKIFTKSPVIHCFVSEQLPLCAFGLSDLIFLLQYTLYKRKRLSNSV